MIIQTLVGLVALRKVMIQKNGKCVMQMLTKKLTQCVVDLGRETEFVEGQMRIHVHDHEVRVKLRGICYAQDFKMKLRKMLINAVVSRS